jgi:hypothetical protein
MTWDENWSDADRPDLSEISQYNFFTNSRGKKIFTFYIAWFVIVALALKFVGTTGTIFLDIPVLIWITLIANLLSIAVLLFWVYIPERRRTTGTN